MPLAAHRLLVLYRRAAVLRVKSAEEIVGRSLQLLGMPFVLMRLLFVGGEPLADPAQQGREGAYFGLSQHHLSSHAPNPFRDDPALVSAM